MTRDKTENKVIYVRPEDWTALKQRSKQEGRSIAEIIHRFLLGPQEQ